MVLKCWVGIILLCIWQCLETIFHVTTRRMIVALGSLRAGMLPKKLHYTNTTSPYTNKELSWPKCQKCRSWEPDVKTSPSYKLKLAIYRVGSLQKINFREKVIQCRIRVLREPIPLLQVKGERSQQTSNSSPFLYQLCVTPKSVTSTVETKWI